MRLSRSRQSQAHGLTGVLARGQPGAARQNQHPQQQAPQAANARVGCDPCGSCDDCDPGRQNRSHASCRFLSLITGGRCGRSDLCGRPGLCGRCDLCGRPGLCGRCDPVRQAQPVQQAAGQGRGAEMTAASRARQSGQTGGSADAAISTGHPRRARPAGGRRGMKRNPAGPQIGVWPGAQGAAGRARLGQRRPRGTVSVKGHRGLPFHHRGISLWSVSRSSPGPLR